jgi:hypothetical protein
MFWQVVFFNNKGLIGLYSHWGNWKKGREDVFKEIDIETSLLSSYLACFILKNSSRFAFSKFKRSTTTPEIINEISGTFEHYFPLEEICEN